MDRFRKSLSESLITRFISYCLITQLIFPPLWVNNVYAALVTDPHAAVSFRPQIDNTYNIPVINIVAPNNTGLSHNKYQDFDVDLNGLVFNNSLVTGNSRLAGSIVANPLFGGRTASIILNEVTGASDSELKGLMEVFGDKANVIIANPNGITCNGCGFINTQRGTLTTGTPDVSQGKLRFDIDGGLIRFEEEGHSYRSFIDEIDVLSQYIDVNGDISTKDRLSLVAGRFIFDYSKSMAGGSLTEWVEPKAYDAAKGSERALAVDGTIFGAMQSGQIDIMGTEQGLGVKADGYLFAQADDLFIQSAGGLSINNADAVREIKLSAEDDITISADLIANLAISAKAGAIETTEETNLIANKIDLNAEKNIHLNGEMKALELNVEAETIVSEADLLAINALAINAKKEAIFKNSAIGATNADIKTIELEILNASFNAPTLSIETEKTLIENATIEVNDLTFNLGDAITNNFKLFSEIATINYENWNDNNSQWNIGKLALSGKKLTSQNGSWLFNDGSINATDLILKESTLFSYNANITAANLSSNNSAIYTEKLTLTISQALKSIGDRWRILPFSEQSEILDAGTLKLTAAASEFTGSVIQADNLLLNSGRSQFSQTDVFTNTISIEGNELVTDTDSLWVANNSVNLSTTITDLNHAIKTSNIQLEATKADLSGRWLIAENSTINSATSLNIAGLELSADSLIMSFEDGVWDDLVIKSSASNITAKNTLRVSSGTIESGQLSVAADVLTLDEKTWIGANNTNITADRLNNSGTLLAAGELQLNTREIINNGVVASFDKLNITSSEALNNHGKIISDQLVIDSARITNTNSISSENFELNYQSLENKDKAVIVSSNAMYTAKTNTANFANYGTQIASDSIQWLTEGASSGRYINAGLLTGSSLNFTGLNQVTNGVLIDGVMKGTMQAVASSEEEGAQGQLSIGTEAFTQLGTIEADDININRNSFHNEGKIFTEKLTATIKDEFKNSGILASHTIDLSAAELINSQGSTISTNDLNLNQINVNNAGKLIAANIALSGNETAASYFINTDSGLLIQNALKSDGDSPVALGSVSISGFNTFTNRGLIETDALLSIGNITAFNNDSNDLSNLDSAARIVSESGIKLSNIGSLKNSAILVSDAISIKSDNFNNSGILGAGEATIEVAQGDLINSGRIYQSDLHASDSIRKQTSTLENEFKIKANGLINNETSSIELAKGSIDLKEGNLINKGLIGEVEKVGTTTGLSIVNIQNLENHNDISISEDLLIANVGSINNIGEDSYIKANKIIGTGLVSVNNEGKLLANEMIQLESASITNADNANIFSKEIKINTTSFTNNSLIGSELAIEVYATTLINNALAEIYSNNDSINLTGTESVTNKGSILAKVNLSIESALLSNNGIMNAQNKIDINQRSIGTIENNGYIFAETVHLGNETNRQIKISNTSASFENVKGEVVLGGIQSGIGGLEIITSELVNSGQLSSDNDLLINSEQSMTGSNALTGSLETKGRLTLNTSGLDVTSSAKIIALGDDNTIIIGNDFNNDGLVSLNNNSSISSGNLNNSGTLSGNTLDINITDDFSNSTVTSQLYADNLNIVTNSLNNNGLIQANKALGISAATDAVNNNQILSLETLVINGGENSAADSLTNSGTISSKALSLAATTLTNNGDAIITAETADLTATTISNAGTLYQLESDTADAAFNISSQTLTNNDSNATIDIKNGLFNLNTLINQGLIRERQDSSLDSDQLRLTNVKTLNNSGELILYNDLILTDASLINSGENAYIRTNSLTTNKLTDFSNSGKIAAQNVLTLNSEKALTNQGELVANQFTANTQQDFTNQGLVQATTQLEINAQNISNEASAEISKIGTDTNLELSAIGRINNAGNIASKSGLNVSANDIINSQNISSSKTTTLHANSLNNTGLIYGTDLNVGSNEQFIRQTRDEVRPEADVGLELEVETGGLVAANTLSLYTNGLMNDVYRASTIHLESNADLTLAGDIAAEKHINVIAENLTLNKTGSIYIGDSESESLFSMTQALKNEGDISSKSTLLINATDISNIGEIKTSKQLAINANTINTTVNSLISAADTLHISGSGASNNDQATSLITNGDIISDKSLSIQTDLITNNGNLQSAGNLDITAQTLSNAKNIQSNKQLNIIANDITNQASAQLSSIESLIINGAVNNTADSLTNSGTISSKVLNLAATTLTNNGDAIITAETADLTATTISNAGALYQLESETATSAFNITAQTLNNNDANAVVDVKNGLFNLNTLINQGLIRERQENAADSDQLLLTNIKTLNNSGELILYSDLALTDASLINSGNDAYIRANALTANNLTEFSNTGKIAAQHVLTLSRDQGLTNQGELVANQFTANTQQDFINQGLVQANAQLEISARNISNTSTAEISKLGSDSDLKLTATAQLNNAGNIASKGGLKISTDDLVNSKKISSSKTTTLLTKNLDNTGLIYGNNLVVGSNSQYVAETRQGIRTEAQASTGGLFAANTLTMYTQGVLNDAYSANRLSILSRNFLNIYGQVKANQDVDITASNLVLRSTGKINVNLSSAESEWNITRNTINYGKITVGSNLTINTGTLKNSNDLNVAKDLNISTDSFDNTLGAKIIGMGKIGLTSSNNSNLNSASNSGVINSNYLAIKANNFENNSNAVIVAKEADIEILGALNNAGGIYQTAENETFKDNEFNISASTINNTNAIVSKTASIQIGKGSINVEELTNDGQIFETKTNRENSDVLAIKGLKSLTNSGNIIVESNLVLENSKLVNKTDSVNGNEPAYIQAGSITAHGLTSFENDGVLVADDELSLSSQQSLQNSGELVAGAVVIDTAGTFKNLDTVISQGVLSINAEKIVNTQDSSIVAKGSNLTLSTEKYSNSESKIDNAGLIASADNLTIKTILLNNKQTISANGDGVLRVERLDNQKLIFANNLVIGSVGNEVTQERDGIQIFDPTKQVGLVATNSLTLYTSGLMNDVYQANSININSDNSLELAGTINAGKQININAKNLTLNQASSVNISGDSSFDSSTWDLSGEFENNGNINSTSALSISSNSFTNNNDIDVGGSFYINSNSIINSKETIGDTVANLSSKGLLNISGVNGSNNDRAATFVNDGEIVADAGFNLYSDSIVNKNNIKATGDSDWRFSSLKNITESAEKPSRISVDGHWTLGTASDRVGTVDNNGKLYGKSINLYSNDDVENNESSQLVAYEGSLLIDTLGNINNDGSIYSKNNFTLKSALSINNNATIESVNDEAPASLMSAMVVNNGNGLDKSGTIKVASDLTLSAEIFNNNSYEFGDFIDYEKVRSYNWWTSRQCVGCNGETRFWANVTYQSGQYKKREASKIEVGGTLIGDRGKWYNTSSTIMANDIDISGLSDIENKISGAAVTEVSLQFSLKLYNNKKAYRDTLNSYNSNYDKIAEEIYKSGNSYYWNVIDGLGIINSTRGVDANVIISEDNQALITAKTLTLGKNTNIKNEGVIKVITFEKEELEDVSKANQVNKTDVNNTDTNLADSATTGENQTGSEHNESTKNIVIGSNQHIYDATVTSRNEGATTGSDRIIQIDQPNGLELNSGSVADYVSTAIDLISAQTNDGASQTNDKIVNSGLEVVNKDNVEAGVAIGSAASLEGLDATSDHVKGSFINGADGLVIQVANRKPTASISLLSFIIPGLSFDALSAASVAGGKTPEEIAAQVALQAQLDLLESDKEKNSDTIKGQSNSYNTQAPSLFDLDEDILQRIIADTEYELSPEYIFDKVDPDKILDTEPKFFLDPYQEAQAVTQAALQQTGTAYFSPDWSTSADQRKGLYDNTLAYLGTQQDVTLGNALTPMQVKQLEQPMIWYVSMDIGGQSQLVPTVYLPEATLAQITTPSAGTIIADSMDIDVGEFKNTGDIKVANSARIKADVITNQRNVMTFGDSTNYGAIAGSGGNISAGNLALISRSDINNNGGILSALNGLTLDAQKDINLNALELKQRSQQGKNITESTDYLLSQINAGGDATFKAGGDFNSQAAQAKIGGNGIFDATNINLLGVTERDYSKTVKKKKGNFSSSKKTIEQENLNFVGSDFQVGGSMVMNAENDITMVGANIDVGKSAAIKAGNDITLTAGISTDKYSKDKSGSGVATTSSQQKGHIKETATGTMIKTGESLQIDSDGGNVTILASELDAQQSLVLGDMKVKVDEDGNKMVDENGQYIAEDGSSINNLTIGTVELKDESWNVKSSGLKGPLKDLAAVAAFAISASPLGQMAMAAGLDTEIEVGKTSESRVESTTHATSTITAGETLAIKTDGDFRLEGSEANAKSASIETRSTTITAVENTTTITESESTHTVGATKATLKKDEVTVAGSTETKHSETTTTTDTELVKAGLNISGDLGMTSVENIDILASDVNVEGSAAVKAKTITVAGLAETTTTEHKEKTETTTTSVGVKNAYVDTAFAIQAVVDAGAAVDAAKSALDQAKRDVKNGTLQANAIGDYEANLVAATTQLGQATLSAAASAATAAGTTGTGGFYASGSAEKTIVEKTSTDTEERYIGSNFNVGGDASFDASDNIDIIGSSMDIAGGLALNAKDITIKAGTEETTSTSSETTRTAGASYSTNGGASANASGSNTDADSYSKTHINSTINAGSLTSTSDNLTLSGANVEIAGNIDIDTGNLTIESLQDESSSSSKTEGYSASANIGGDKSISPGNFGANENSSNADSKWVNNQTTLIGGTSGEGEVNITADSTTLTGAVLASATRNEDGSLTDNGTLNLATDELIIEDLKDKDHSESKGFDVSTSVGYNSDNPDTKSTDEGYLTGSTTVGLTSDGHKKEQNTLATLGGGNITKKDGSAHEEGLVESANSDLNNSQEITKDMKTGGLNATVTVDHRLLSENGLNDIAEDIAVAKHHAKEIGTAVTEAVDDGENVFGRIRQHAKNREGVVEIHNDDEIQEALNDGTTDAEGNEIAMQGLADKLAKNSEVEGADVNLYDGAQTNDDSIMLDKSSVNKGEVEGAYDKANKDIYVNVDKTDMTDGAEKVGTVAHEAARNRMGQEEGRTRGAETRLATNEGDLAKDLWNDLNGAKGIKTGKAAGNNQQEWLANNRNSSTVKEGTDKIGKVDSKDLRARQANRNEASMLDKARSKINNDTTKTGAEKAEQLTNLDALACAEIQCAAGVSANDPQYDAVMKLQNDGEKLKAEQGLNIIDTLSDLGIGTTIGVEETKVTNNFLATTETETTQEPQFGYSVKDGIQDLASSEADGFTNRVNSAAVGVTNAVVTTVVAPIVDLVDGQDNGAGFTEYMAEKTADNALDVVNYESKVGESVLNSLSSDTHKEAPNYVANTALAVLEVIPGAKVAKDSAGIAFDKAKDVLDSAKNKVPEIDVPKVDVSNVKPEGNFSNVNDPENTFRGPNSPEILRADVEHPQQTGSRVTDPNKVIADGEITAADLRKTPKYKRNRKEVVGDDKVCEYCQKKPATQSDHIEPVDQIAKEGRKTNATLEELDQIANKPENLAGSCGGKKGCNPTKSNRILSLEPGPGKFVPENPTDRIINKINEYDGKRL